MINSKKSYRGLLLLVIPIGFWAWSMNGDKSPAAYVKWVEAEKNGLKIIQEKDDFEFTLQFTPTTYRALLEIGAAEFSGVDLDRKVAELEGLQYFTLKLKRKGRQDLLDYQLNGFDRSQNHHYLAFGIQKQLKLMQNENELPCVLHHYQGPMGVAPYHTILLAFENSPAFKGDKVLIYQDDQFSGEILKFSIKESALKNIPPIKTQL